MSIRIITDKNLWDRFVEDSPYGLLFHKWDFLKIAERHSHNKLFTYGIYKGNELICICPVFLKKQLNMSFVFSPPPSTGIPYLGFLMGRAYDQVRQRRKEEYLNSVIEDLQNELRKFAPRYFQMVTVPGFVDIRPFLWTDYATKANFTYVIDLKTPLEEIWKGFDDNCKKNIRHCERYALEIRESKDAVEFFRIMAHRYGEQKLNIPIISPDYLAELIAAYPDNLKMYFLYHDDTVIGIELVCEYRNRLMLWLGESLIQRDIPANYYMRWEFIKRASARGFDHLEIEGANTPHLCANKSRFNPGLDHGYIISKKDAVGEFAEWTYRNFMKKKVMSL